jgi:hypothetical protein
VAYGLTLGPYSETSGRVAYIEDGYLVRHEFGIGLGLNKE